MPSSLFDEMEEKIKDIDYYPAFFNAEESARYFAALKSTTEFETKSIVLKGGKTVPQPRLVAWYGDNETVYKYSGTTNVAKPWTKSLTEIREKVSEFLGYDFNSVFLNLYRDGQDSIGFHADDEDGFGPSYPNNVIIASISFGSTRKFILKRNSDNFQVKYYLQSGSLLVMGGRTQSEWKHSIPKTGDKVGERINLTFRIVQKKLISR